MNLNKQAMIMMKQKNIYISLTIIINENNKPIIMFNNKAIKKENIYTLPHNTKSLLHSINLLKNKITKNTFIINKNKINNKHIKIVTPKKTQKVKNTDK